MPANADNPAGFAEAPHYHGHRERLRERFRDAGPDALSDYELLEMVLFRALPRRDVKPLAKSLIGRFGSFAEVVHAPDARLREISGLGESAIIELELIAATASRVAKGQLKQRTVLSSWAAVIDYCRTSMAFADKEQCSGFFDKPLKLLVDVLPVCGETFRVPPPRVRLIFQFFLSECRAVS